MNYIEENARRVAQQMYHENTLHVDDPEASQILDKVLEGMSAADFKAFMRFWAIALLDIKNQGLKEQGFASFEDIRKERGEL